MGFLRLEIHGMLGNHRSKDESLVFHLTFIAVVKY